MSHSFFKIIKNIYFILFNIFYYITEKLHKELYEVNSLYTQHVNVLQSNISELEKKKEELQVYFNEILQ